MDECLRLARGNTIQAPLTHRCCWVARTCAWGSYENRGEKLRGDRTGPDKGTGRRSCGPRSKWKPSFEMGGRGRTLAVFRLQGTSRPVPDTPDRVAAQTFRSIDRRAPPSVMASPDGVPRTRCSARPVPEGTPTSSRERPAARALRVLLAVSLATRLVPCQPRPAVHRAVRRHQLLCLPSGG